MDLPPALVDTTTIIANHSVRSHYLCIFLRCMLGLYFVTAYDGNLKEKGRWNAFFALAAYFFWTKYMLPRQTWKVYARTIAVLLLSIVILHTVEHKDAKLMVGLLFIVDALMGMQSRHTATLLRM